MCKEVTVFAPVRPVSYYSMSNAAAHIIDPKERLATAESEPGALERIEQQMTRPIPYAETSEILTRVWGRPVVGDNGKISAPGCYYYPEDMPPIKVPFTVPNNMFLYTSEMFITLKEDKDTSTTPKNQ